MFSEKINCGYARVAIRTFSQASITKEKRQQQFQAMFKQVSGYIPDSTYFDAKEKQRETKFERGCTHILKQFNKKWHPSESRCEYMAIFSPESWKRLPLHTKRMHTLQNCAGCRLHHANLQAKFPGTVVTASSTELIDSSAYSASATMALEPIRSKQAAQCATRKALSVINEVSEGALGMPFSKAIVKYCPEEKVVNKPTDTERKRKVMRKCTKHLEKQMGELS